MVAMIVTAYARSRVDEEARTAGHGAGRVSQQSGSCGNLDAMGDANQKTGGPSGGAATPEEIAEE